MEKKILNWKFLVGLKIIMKKKNFIYNIIIV